MGPNQHVWVVGGKENEKRRTDPKIGSEKISDKHYPRFDGSIRLHGVMICEQIYCRPSTGCNYGNATN